MGKTQDPDYIQRQGTPDQIIPHKKSDPKVAFSFVAVWFDLLDDRFQFTLGIPVCHRFQ
jgi:hypothetical protein